MTEVRPTDEFVALGHAGSEHYAGLETFENPGVTRVEMTSDELTAVCPITGQPDMYVATIEYEAHRLCLESKSLKLYLARYRNEGGRQPDHDRPPLRSPRPRRTRACDPPARRDERRTTSTVDARGRCVDAGAHERRQPRQRKLRLSGRKLEAL
jgi:hypothetical protein